MLDKSALQKVLDKLILHKHLSRVKPSITFRIVNARRGHASFLTHSFTIPIWALETSDEFAVAYLCHEFAHLVKYFKKDWSASHSSAFHQIEDSLLRYCGLYGKRERTYIQSTSVKVFNAQAFGAILEKKGGENMTTEHSEAEVKVDDKVTASEQPAINEQPVTSAKKERAKKATTTKASATKKLDEKAPEKKERNQFEKVRDGICPHCDGKLDKAVVGSGVGKTRTCLDWLVKKCLHRWYFNVEIKTSKCLTCAEEKRIASKPTPAPKPSETKKDKE